MIALSYLTSAIFYINAAVDEGKSCSLDAVKSAITAGTIFDFLKAELGVDPISLIDKQQDRDKLLDLWQGLVEHMDEGRKAGVTRNGLCLMIAYLLETIQRHGERDL